MNPRFLVVLLLFCSSPGRVQSQAINNSRYIITASRLGTEDGLVSSNVLCGLQDSRGFVWFGTTEGLQRYDGRQFRLFDKTTAGLQFNKIGQIAEDRDGRLWIHYGSDGDRLLGTVPVTVVLDLTTYAIRPLSKALPRLPFRTEELKWFFADEQRNLFLITTGNQVWWYRGHGDFRLLIKERNRFSFFPHSSLYQSWSGHVWLSSDSSMVHVDTAGHVQECRLKDRPDLNVFQVMKDGSALGMARRELLGRAGEPPVFVRVSTQGQIVADTFRPFRNRRTNDDADYLLEYHSDLRTQGVMMHNPNIGLLLLTDTAAIPLLDTAALYQDAPLSPYAYFTDRHGGHWLCSSNGVYRFKIEPRYFTSYLTRQQLTAPTAVGYQARGIWSDGKDGLYIARDGLYHIASTSEPADLERLSTVHPLAVDGDDQYLWYTSFFEENKGLFRMGRRRGPPEEVAAPGPLELWGMLLAADGVRYVGGRNFIGMVDGNRVEAIQPCSGGDSLKGICYQFLEPGDGRLIAVTDKGLYAVHKGCYTKLSQQPPSLRLHHVFIDKKTALWWLCTAGDGLYSWNPRNGASQRWTTGEGLPSNVLYGLLQDGRGLFWISSGNGLIRFDPRTGRSRVFTRRDGLPHNEFNRSSFFCAPDGIFYFGGLNGVAAVRPLEVPADEEVPYTPPLRLLSLQTYNGEAGGLQDRMSDYLAGNRVIVHTDDRYLVAQVALLEYSEGLHRYEYRVEGLDAAWRTSADGAIRLDHLPYGNYVLQIRGLSGEGGRSGEELKLPLRVLAPFYRRPAFIIMAILAVVALVWLLVRARLRILARTNRRLEAVVQERTRELRELLTQKDVLMKEIHHRVKNNLQVISALQQMQSARSKDPQVKAALEESQNRVLSIAFIHHNLYQHDDLKGVEMQSFVQELTTHIASVFAVPGKEIAIHTHITALSLDIDTAVPLGLIINELLTNSYKYAFEGRNEGRIVIRLDASEEVPGEFRLRYSDDGPGLPADVDLRRTRSLGLRLVNQLSRQLAGQLDYSGGAGGFYNLRFYNFESRNREP